MENLRTKLDNFSENEYIYVYTDTFPIGIRKYEGCIQKFNPLNPYLGWRTIIQGDFSYLEKFPFKVFSSKDEFFLELKHDFLEPEFQDMVRLESEVNYKLIKEEIEEFSGQRVYDNPEEYFVGAVYGLIDFYYLYWKPDSGEFTYKSCAGLMEKTDPSKTLSVEQIKKLREDIKKIYDVPLPSSLLLSPLG